MQGSIRLVVGLMLVFGAVGGMDADPAIIIQANSLVLQVITAIIGLVFMQSGVNAMKRSK